MSSIRITAQERDLKTKKPSTFEPSARTVRPWHAGHADEEDGVLIVRGRKQHRLTIEESYQLIDAIADTVEQFERAAAEVEEQWEQRPYYTSEGQHD